MYFFTFLGITDSILVSWRFEFQLLMEERAHMLSVYYIVVIWSIPIKPNLRKYGNKLTYSHFLNRETNPFRQSTVLTQWSWKIARKNCFQAYINHLHDNNLLYKYQSGFLPSHSTTFQLIDVYHHICQTFDNNQYAWMVFCTLSKTFDRVWHKGLIFKLKQYGISDEVLNWLTDFLDDRQQKVFIKLQVQL